MTSRLQTAVEQPRSSRSALCIANFFPPAAASGTHRTRAVVRYLPSFGWRPVVVTVKTDPTDPYTGYDPSLLRDLPDNLTVYRTWELHWLRSCAHALSRARALLFARRPAAAGPSASSTQPGSPAAQPGLRGLLRCLTRFPDGAIGWLPSGLSAALWAVVHHRCRAIYSTAPHFTSHLIALLTKQLTRRPWVADFRDPWRANPFRKIPYRAVDCCDVWLERCVVETADRIVCNTEPMRADFVRRFPGAAEKFVTITNGFDPADFTGLVPRRNAGPEKIALTHTGWFYGRRRPDSLFRALALLNPHHGLGQDVVLQLVGDPTYEGRPLLEIAAQYGVAERVQVVGEVAHREALEYGRGSDIQLVVGFSGPGSDLQVPAKLFEYFGVGRPVLALATAGSAIADIVVRSGIPAEVCDPDNPEAIAAAVTRLALRRSETAFCQSNGNGPLVQFHRRAQVARLAGLLDAIA